MDNFRSVRKAVRRYRFALRVLAAIAVAVSIVGPAWSYFAGFAPPLFPPLGYAMSVASAIVVAMSVRDRALTRRVPIWVLFSVFLVVSLGYTLSYFAMTVPPPGGREGPAMQVGLTLEPWSLNAKTIEWMDRERAAGFDDFDKQTLLLARGAYEQGGVRGAMLVWKPWVIGLCGSWLVLLFVASFVMWALIMGRLIRVLKRLKLSEIEDALSVLF